MSVQEKAMEKLEAMNSDIRNQVFQKLDEKNVAALLLKNNLISDKNPVYLEHEPAIKSEDAARTRGFELK